MDSRLNFHDEILKNVIAEDSLSVFAAGLGMEIVQINLIKILQNPKSIVFILNSTNDDRSFIIKHSLNPQNLKIVDSKVPVKTRMKFYTSPGVYFIPARIFIYDILVRKVPVDMLTGLLVFNAHEVEKSAHLEFGLKLFNQNNKTAFVKAFSNFPSFFKTDFNITSRVLKKLHVQNILLWPRFHVKISEELDLNDIDVVELDVPLTKHQEIIQSAIVAIIGSCLQNLIKNSSEVSLYKNQLTTANILSTEYYKNFLNISRSLISEFSQQLCSDIKRLRSLLLDLINLNAFEFEEKINYLKKLYKICFSSSSGSQFVGNWLFCESAESLFIHSTERISFITTRYSNLKNELNPQILEEIHPKWKALLDIFNEISLNNLENQGLEKWKILILCNPKTKISSFFKFRSNPANFLKKRIENCQNFEEKIEIDSDEDLGYNSNINDIEDEIPVDYKLSDIRSYSDKIEYKVVKPSDEYFLFEELESFKPHFVIFFNVCLEWIRKIEVFKAINEIFLLRIYMVVHKNSIEEQIYLSSLEAEKESFEILIKEKAVISIQKPEEIPKIDDEINLEVIADSRKTEEKISGKVIVDIREFGSELPLVLHKTGFNIIPVTLEIGDYILSPDIGIERKSVPDLVGSLNSGRLYDQAMALARHYKTPFLLIEFSDSKAFKAGILSKRMSFGGTSRLDSFYVQSKLLLLTLHCPTLRILWSPSPDLSSKLFFELKKDKPDPDVELISTITSYETSDCVNVSTNRSYDHLLRLSGVTNKNAPKIAKKAENFYQISRLTLEEMKDLLNDDGEKIYQLFNTEIKFNS